MHGQVGVPVEHGSLHLLHEDSLTADRVQRYVGALVAQCLDEDQFDLTGSGAAAYVPKATFGPDRLSEVWVSAGIRTDSV